VAPQDLAPGTNGASSLTDGESVPAPEPVTSGTEPCPACGHRGAQVLYSGSDRLYRTTSARFSVIECSGCRLLRLFPRPTPTELRGYYPDNYWFLPDEDATSRLEELYRRLVLRDHVHFVSRAVKRAGRRGLILDVGCGGGLFLRMMAERGHRVLGLDFSLSAASIAWHGKAIPAVCGTLSKPPVADGSCTAVTMFHVLEHLYDPVEYLESARRVLTDDGVLILQVPNAACWQLLLLGENWTGLDIPRHLFDFKLGDLEILLDQCGFEITRAKFFSLRDNPAGLASSIAPGLDPMARRVRRVPETSGVRLWRDLLYFFLVLAALPFTLVEAAGRAGSTVFVEARKKP